MTFLHLDGLTGYGTSEGVRKSWEKRRRAIKEFQHPLRPASPLASHLADLIEKQGGFTYDPIHAQSPHSGYMVSILKEYEQEFSSVQQITARAVQMYMQRMKPIVTGTKNAHIGGWVDDKTGKVYLDVSIHVEDSRRALWLAMANRQIGIFDLKNFRTIYTHARQLTAQAVNAKSWHRFDVPWEVALKDPQIVVDGVKMLYEKYRGTKT